MRVLFRAAGAALFCLSLFSCGAGRSATPDGAGPRRLVVYSSHPAELSAAVVKEFRQRTGVAVLVSTGETGELIGRLRSPAAKGADRADVFWGGGAESLNEARDLFASYRSPESASVPPAYRDAQDRWTGFSLNPTVIIYNTRLVPPAEAPRGWRDLTRPFFRGRVALADPAISGFAYTALATAMRAVSGRSPFAAKAWAFVDSLLLAIAGEPQAAASRVYAGVAAGGWFAGVCVESAAVSLKASGADIGIVYPAEGTSIVPDGVAIAASARNAADAKLFVDFLLSRDAQRVISDTWRKRSVRADVEAPRGIPAPESIRLVDYVGRSSENEKREIIAEWTRRLELIASRP